MTGKNEKVVDVYIVPFGREEGSFLDVLKLPPDAPPKDVAKRDGEYRTGAKAESKKKKKELLDKKKKKEITPEEHDAKFQEVDEEQNQKLTNLNALKAKYEAVQAEQRKLGNKGLKDDRQVWMDIYGALLGEAKDFWKWLAHRRPLGTLQADLVAAIELRWLSSAAPLFLVSSSGLGKTPLEVLLHGASLPTADGRAHEVRFRRDQEQKRKTLQEDLQARLQKGEITPEESQAESDRARKQRDDDLQVLDRLKKEYRAALDPEKWAPADLNALAFPDLPSTRALNTSTLGLATLADLVAERDLLPLLIADSLWGEVRYTNRVHWTTQLAEWTDELKVLGPHFTHEAAKKPDAVLPFPSLSKPTNRVIDKLDAHEREEFSHRPNRDRKTKHEPDIEALLAALAETGDAPEGQASSGARHASLDDLEALMEKLAAMSPPPPT